MVIAPEGQVLHANPAACRMLSTTLERLAGLRFEALFPPGVGQQLQDIFHREMLVGSMFLRLPMRSLSGTQFTVEVTLRQIQHSEGTFLLAYIKDISEQERIEVLLRRHEKVLEATRNIAQRLLKTQDFEATLPEALSLLVTSFQASSASVYRNYSGQTGILHGSLVAAWDAPHAPPLPEHTHQTDFTYEGNGLHRWAEILSKGETIFGFVEDFPIIEQQFMMQRNIQCIMVTPIFQGKRWWGILALQRATRELPWNRNDLESLQVIASMFGETLQREDIEANLRQRQQALEILQDITTDALNDTPTQKTLNALAAHLSTLVNADACFITLWDEEAKIPIPTAAYGLLEDVYHTLHPPVSGEQTLTYHALQNQRTILIEDTAHSTYPIPSWEAYPATRALRSMMVIPMLAGTQRMGAALLGFKQPRAFSLPEQRAAEQATQQVALALAKTRLLGTTRRQLSELRVLHNVSLSLTSTLDEETLLKTFTQMVGEAFYSEHFGVLLLDEETNTLELRAAYHQGTLTTDMIGTRFDISKGITGHVIRSGEVYCSGNVPQDSRYVAFNPNVLSEICVPVRAGHRILGVLNAESIRQNAFDKTDERLLSTLAGQLGTALLQVRLFEAERKRRREAETLQQVSTALVSSLDLNEVLHNIMILLQRVIPYDSATIIFLEDDLPRVMASSGYAKDVAIQPPPEVMQRPHIQHLLREKEPVLIADTHSSEASWLHIPGSEYIRSWMGVPLLVQGRVIGWLNIDKKEPHFYTPATMQLALAFASQAAIALENAHLYNELETSYLQTVLALARAMDARDTYTADHSNSLAKMACAIARELHCDSDEIQAIEWAAILHDIGKIGVPDHILRKPGKLNKDEWEIMKRHPDIGAEIIAPVQRLKRVAPIVRAHQEKFDGSGYPRGLRGEEIPLGARILAVVDAYSAITDERVYRKGRSHEEAVAELKRCAGTHFDPRIVEIFLDLIQKRGAL